MSAAVITQLLVAFGPSAIQLIQQLVAVWNQPTLTADQVNAIIGPLIAKTPQDYLNAAQGSVVPPVIAPKQP